MVAKPKPTKKLKSKKPLPPKIKKLDPDEWFSLCVRERAGWICQSCGKSYEPWTSTKGLPANPGLHCSHYIGRANYATRFEPLNADAHCYGCHSKFEGNPHIFKEWKEKQLGNIYDVLIEKSENIMLGKQARREKQEIAVHYKAEFDRLQELRNSGTIGRINFQGYF